MFLYEIEIKKRLEKQLKDNLHFLISGLNLDAELTKALINYFNTRKLNIFLALPFENFNNKDYIPAISIYPRVDNIIDYPINIGFKEDDVIISGDYLYSGNFTEDSDIYKISGIEPFDIWDVRINDELIIGYQYSYINNIPQIKFYNIYPSGSSITFYYNLPVNEKITATMNILSRKVCDIYILTDNEYANTILYYIVKEILWGILYDFMYSSDLSISNCSIAQAQPPAGESQLLPATIYSRVLQVNFDIFETLQSTISASVLRYGYISGLTYQNK